MKKTIALLILMCTVIILISCSISSKKIESFSLAEYNDCIEEFSVDISYNMHIETRDDAVKIAEQLFAKEFGESAYSRRPYIVSYDGENKVWLVQGTLPKGMFGGVPYLLIKENGEVIAIWHDK